MLTPKLRNAAEPSSIPFASDALRAADPPVRRTLQRVGDIDGVPIPLDWPEPKRNGKIRTSAAVETARALIRCGESRAVARTKSARIVKKSSKIFSCRPDFVSLPGARTDIDELIQRKLTRDDYEVLLVQDTTRFTRGGIAHDSNLEYRLNAVGVETVFVTDNIIDGDFGDLQKAVLYLGGKQHAKSISMATSRGSMSSLLADRSAHCRLPPYGIDRLYIASDGTPSHIIRNLPDGSQVKLDPTTNAVLGRFGRSARSGTRQHYIKQTDERIVLVPGAPEAVCVISLIFRKYHLNGWGCRRIAAELNAQGIPSARGRNWSTTAVSQILHNPTYVGLGIANRSSAGIYTVRSPNQPKPSDVDEKTLATSKVPPRKLRPRSEWFERHEKALETLLDADVRAVALAKLDSLMDKLARVPQKSKGKDRHAESDFILKGILTSKQDGHPMTGRKTGRRGKRVRYYGVTKSQIVPVRGSVLNRLIQAEPIERAVIAALEETLRAKDNMRQCIERMARQQIEASRDDNADSAPLREQREALVSKLSFLIDELDDIGRDVAKAKIAQLQSQLRGLDHQISQTEQRSSLGDQNVDEIVESVLNQLDDLASNIFSLKPVALRRVLQLFIAKLEVCRGSAALHFLLWGERRGRVHHPTGEGGNMVTFCICRTPPPMIACPSCRFSSRSLRACTRCPMCGRQSKKEILLRRRNDPDAGG